jgi:UDPglucose 6-dehydrogenase
VKLRLSVVGLGKLGLPMLTVFAHKGFEVIGVDLDSASVASLNAGRSPISEPGVQDLIDANRSLIRATTDMRDAVLNSEATFIIVPTPSGEDRFFRNDNVMAALRSIGGVLREKQGYHNVVVTSTVMPGSTGGALREVLEATSGRKVGNELGLCYSPEFIALGSVVRDLLHPDMVLIGECDSKSGDMLEYIYRSTAESDPEFQRMNWVNAELCKIAVNTYVTTKISYANMIAEMCDLLAGADADVVTSALGADSRIGKKYIKGAVGYGGPCFPRDNKAFAALGRRLGMKADLAEATDTINDRQTDRLRQAIEKHVPTGGRVAILGLSYKPNTEVIDASQGLALALALVEKGFKVVVSDPEAMPGLQSFLDERIERAENTEEAIRDADAVAIMTPWAAYKNIPPAWFGQDEQAKVVIDPWRVVASASLYPGVRHIRLGMGDWMNRQQYRMAAE